MIKNHLSQVLHSNCVYCTFSIIDKNSMIDEEKKNYSINVEKLFWLEFLIYSHLVKNDV